MRRVVFGKSVVVVLLVNVVAVVALSEVVIFCYLPASAVSVRFVSLVGAGFAFFVVLSACFRPRVAEYVASGFGLLGSANGASLPVTFSIANPVAVEAVVKLVNLT